MFNLKVVPPNYNFCLTFADWRRRHHSVQTRRLRLFPPEVEEPGGRLLRGVGHGHGDNVAGSSPAAEFRGKQLRGHHWSRSVVQPDPEVAEAAVARVWSRPTLRRVWQRLQYPCFIFLKNVQVLENVVDCEIFRLTYKSRTMLFRERTMLCRERTMLCTT